MVSPAFAAPPTVASLYPAGARRGTTAVITAAGTFERWPVQGWVSGSGVEVRAGKDKGQLTVSVSQAALPGLRWLRLYDEQGASAPRPLLVGMLAEIGEQEPNDEPSKPQQLERAAIVINGRLERPGDVDGFAVRLVKGQTLVAALEANATLRSPMDAILQVASTDGFVLANDHDSNRLDPFVTFTAPKDGQYIVRTFAFPATPDASIRFSGAPTYIYRLTLTACGYADHALPLAVPRAAPTAVELAGWNITPDVRWAPVTPTDDPDQSIAFHPDVANPVPVRLEPHACAVKPPGETPFPFTPPLTVTGRLDQANAADTYALAAKKGEKLLFRIEAQSLGRPVTAVLRLTDATGKELARVEPARQLADPELAFTAPEDGTYHLTVRDLFGHGGPRYAYLLRAAAPQPDFALTAKAERFTLAAGQSLDLPVAIQRSNGLTGEIDLSVEGLPTGVDSTVAARTAAQVTLKLTARTDVRFNGPIRIVGHAPGLTRTATAPVPEAGETTPVHRVHDLWLTVTPPKK